RSGEPQEDAGGLRGIAGGGGGRRAARAPDVPGGAAAGRGRPAGGGGRRLGSARRPGRIAAQALDGGQGLRKYPAGPRRDPRSDRGALDREPHRAPLYSLAGAGRRLPTQSPRSVVPMSEQSSSPSPSPLAASRSPASM